MAINDEVSLFEEIEEELKQDKRYAMLKKHKKSISSVLSVIVIAIVAYSSWHAKKQQKLETITTAFVEVLRDPASEKSAGLLESLAEEAPAEIKPLLSIIKSGRQLQIAKAVSENANGLIALSKQGGVDQIWKDLAIIICASHNVVSGKQLIAMLEPLTEESRPFKFMAMELLAFMYLNENQKDNGKKYLQKILDHKEAPKTLKERISMILNHIKNSENK